MNIVVYIEDGVNEAVRIRGFDSYRFSSKTDPESLARNYELSNTLYLTLTVPRNDLNAGYAEYLRQWSSVGHSGEDYYRTVYVQIYSEWFEKSIVFSDARLSLSQNHKPTEDYIVYELTLEQKESRYRYIVAGGSLEEVREEYSALLGQ